MELLDPATGTALPASAIQRVLFISNAVHVYNIPPLSSTKGHTAGTWTTDPSRHIFTARLRLVETSFEEDDSNTKSSTSSSSSLSSTSSSASASVPGIVGRLKVDVVLEDSSTGQLFAAAPYTAASVVEPALDSSRFFAVTVRDPQGRKAVLGIGFEERAEAFDLGVALQEAARALGWESAGASSGNKSGFGSSGQGAAAAEPPKDYSLKEGETITINLGGGKGRRRPQPDASAEPSGPVDLQAFALAPPPGGAASGGGGFSSLAAPPSAADVKRQRRKSAKDMGFDDGQFGEFE